MENKSYVYKCAKTFKIGNDSIRRISKTAVEMINIQIKIPKERLIDASLPFVLYNLINKEGDFTNNQFSGEPY